MQQKLISAAEYAKLRNLARSTVSRQIANGKIPTVNGKIDPVAADRARDDNLNQVRRAQAARLKVRKKSRSKQRIPVEGADPIAVMTLARIGSPGQQLRFGAAALAIGCTVAQAVALGEWHFGAACEALNELTVEQVIEAAPQVNSETWATALGKFDSREADKFYEAAEQASESVSPR